jgi:assimilatory nitrate reductase catalytic subunit
MDRCQALFGDGERFPTDDGRARFVPTPYRPLTVPADRRWPLLLNTGRVRDQWHTMTRTGRLARLMAHRPEPLLDVHPDDAARLGLVEGGLASVESRHAATVLPTRLSADQRPGEVFAPMHWTDQFTSAGPIDRLVGAATDPISGQPELKATPVRVIPVAPIWHGLLLRGSEQPLHGPVLLGPGATQKGTCLRSHRLGTLSQRARHRGLDYGAARCLSAADLVIYADPGRGTSRRRRPARCVPFPGPDRGLPAAAGGAGGAAGDRYHARDAHLPVRRTCSRNCGGE